MGRSALADEPGRQGRERSPWLPPLEGKVAFVSGASRGIGEALARRFAERGMRLALCARGEPVLSEGVDVLSRRIDVRDAEAVEAFTREIESRFGGVDLWVNNAGVLEPIRPLRDVRVHEFRDHLDTNLVGVFIGTRCYVRHLRRIGRGGVLVNMSSGAAWKPYAGWAAYCAGKAAVERLTEVVAAEEGRSVCGPTPWRPASSTPPCRRRSGPRTRRASPSASAS